MWKLIWITVGVVVILFWIAASCNVAAGSDLLINGKRVWFQKTNNATPPAPRDGGWVVYVPMTWNKCDPINDNDARIVGMPSSGYCNGGTFPQATPLPQPTTAPQGGPPASQGASWTPDRKCDWLRRNVPQNDDELKNRFASQLSVPRERIQVHKYSCGGGEVIDGFILLGTNDNRAFTGDRKISVPPGGAIDGYPGAKFSQQAEKVGDSTYRAYAGTVEGNRLSYYFFSDAHPPAGI